MRFLPVRRSASAMVGAVSAKRPIRACARTGSRLVFITTDPVSGYPPGTPNAPTRHGVAIAQYEPAGDGVAEIAIVVAPAWRRAGLAGVLVQLLAEAAADRGIHTFIASYLAENRPVAALLRTPANSAPSGSNRASPNARSPLTKTMPVQLTRSRIKQAGSEPAASSRSSRKGRPADPACRLCAGQNECHQ